MLLSQVAIRNRPTAMTPEPTHMPQRGNLLAHGAWAAACIVVGLLLVFSGGGGHPPAAILLPLVVLAWVVGHGLLWGAFRLAATGRRTRADAADGQPWPLGLRVAVVGTAAAGLLGVVQVIGTVVTGKWYLVRDAGLWAAMLLVWMVHAACFTALLLRRRSARPFSAALAFGWAALLGVQVVAQLWSGSPDTPGLLIAVAIMVSLLLFGAHLLVSSKTRSFLER